MIYIGRSLIQRFFKNVSIPQLYATILTVVHVQNPREMAYQPHYLQSDLLLPG